MPRRKGTLTSEGVARRERDMIACPRPECGTRHHRFAKCADGVLVTNSRNPIAAPTSPPEPAPAGALTPAAAPLITDPAEIARMRDELEHLRAREEARSAHARAEAESGLYLPLPNILRDRKDRNSDALLGELAKVEKEYTGSAKPSHDEVSAFHRTLQEIPEQRQEKERLAKVAQTDAEHVPGESRWQCLSERCGLSFSAASLEYIRKKAQAEPSWRFVCPHCGGARVILAEREAVA